MRYTVRLKRTSHWTGASSAWNTDSSLNQSVMENRPLLTGGYELSSWHGPACTGSLYWMPCIALLTHGAHCGDRLLVIDVKRARGDLDWVFLVGGK